MIPIDKEDFERVFDQAFEESVKNHRFIPDSGPSWIKVQKLLQHRARRRKRLKVLPYVAASFVLGAVLFGTPTATDAFNPIFKAVTSIKDGVVRIVFGSSVGNEGTATKAKTSPPPDAALTGNSPGSDVAPASSAPLVEAKFSTWEEAAAELGYPKLKFQNVPSGFQLDKVRVLYSANSKKANTAILHYKGEDNKFYNVIMRLLHRNEVLTSGGNIGKTQFKTVLVNGIEAYMFTTADGHSSLELIKDNLYVSITGTLSGKDIVETASGLK
ncbi:DUF4367 domain-containing protein [Paenibacillus sp. GCM10027627]|uniref:DUF4367 domain-containing protein n=1 Tax=unclassified Paenibacillus TaxID=185978 RepID=UPI00363FDDD0